MVIVKGVEDVKATMSRETQWNVVGINGNPQESAIAAKTVKVVQVVKDMKAVTSREKHWNTAKSSDGCEKSRKGKDNYGKHVKPMDNCDEPWEAEKPRRDPPTEEKPGNPSRGQDIQEQAEKTEKNARNRKNRKKPAKTRRNPKKPEKT